MGRYQKARRRRKKTARGGPQANLERLGARLRALWSFAPSLYEWRGQKGGRRWFPVAILLLAVLLFASVLYLLLAAPSRGEEATVVVEEGDTLSVVADKLEEADVVGSSALFKLQARVRGGATEIKTGEYRFAPGEGGGEILDKLESGAPVPTFEVTIPEGLTLEQTAQRVNEQSGIPVEEFEAAARRTDYGYAFLDGAQSTEGFLFPKKYDFYEGADAEQVVDRLLEQYETETKDLDLEGTGRRLDLTERELVTVASLIEKEAADPDEKPLVASVIYNRLRAGMPLQIDATVQYALGGKPKERLTLSDLDVDSPYNTYKEPGLPPGPISSPGLDSIRAALAPARTDYLYYVLKAGGEEHFFTGDYDEFLEAKKESKRAQR